MLVTFQAACDFFLVATILHSSGREHLQHHRPSFLDDVLGQGFSTTALFKIWLIFTVRAVICPVRCLAPLLSIPRQ